MKKHLSFGKVKIQQLNRIAIPKTLLDNLEISIGDEINLFLDIEKEEIVIKKEKKVKK
jgi:bifunctional DNA-binding transcriptional regulator/antitoxin component of YhaV-PrlF toxin-antitoxin module